MSDAGERLSEAARASRERREALVQTAAQEAAEQAAAVEPVGDEGGATSAAAGSAEPVA